jgi:hypothetical protein
MHTLLLLFAITGGKKEKPGDIFILHQRVYNPLEPLGTPLLKKLALGNSIVMVAHMATSLNLSSRISVSFLPQVGTYITYIIEEKTVNAFKELLAGRYDELPEQAFYFVGGIDEAVAKAHKS